jgi:ATP-dependent helicase/DNAse subunit B
MPRFFTLESFVAEALEHGLRQKPRVSGPERMLRLAAAWQHLTGRAAGPGVIHQFDRYIRDCQACRLMPSSKSKDVFDRLTNQYLSELIADGRLDRMSATAALVAEISEPKSWPNRMFLQRFDAILIDGFHRFEPVELELIAALSKVRDVVLWLVGIPETPSWKTVEAATAGLKEKGTQTSVLDHDFEDSAPATPLGAVGRRLFQGELQINSEDQVSPSLARGAMFKLEVSSPLEEVEATAQQIKADYLDSQKTDRPLRLSDVAVIIPGPAYDPLIREVFPRAGLEFNLAGRALLVSTSRPARVLLAAIELIQGRWRYDLLLDFLNQPLVRRKLDDAHRLDDLFEHRPRSRQRMNHEVWSQSWSRQLDRLKGNIEGWNSGRLDLPERTTLSREEYVAKQTELAASVERLIISIQSILKPIDTMERAIENSSEEQPLAELVKVIQEFLGRLEIDQWLTPRMPADGERHEGPVLWVEYEKDQNAYLKLLNILESLKDVSVGRLPRRHSNASGVNPERPDVLAALRLALDGETYQIKTEDDAGVQIFELREIRGMRFRHNYVLGLVNGQIPKLPEEGTLVRRRLNQPQLKAQLEEKETEVQLLFAQVFEAAKEKLVLSRPMLEDDRPTLPSPFLTAVEDTVGGLPDLPRRQIVTGRGQAACELGRAARGKQTNGKLLSDLWPKISPEKATELAPMLAGLAAWQERPVGEEMAIDWPEMIHVLFPDDHLFSASQLESYAACGFRFFGQQILRLEEREADPTRLHYGSLVHRVLQRVYAEKRKRSGTASGRPLPPLTRKDRDLFVELFKEENAQLGDGVLPPDLGFLFINRGGVIDLFLEIAEILEGPSEDFGNRFTEHVLEKVELGKDMSGRPVFLTAKIDRVDVKRSDPRNAIILDYKTGGVPERPSVRVKVADGRMLQLPLYAAALQMEDKELEVVGGAYVHLSEKAKPKQLGAKRAVVSLGNLLGENEEPDELWNARAAVDLALDLATRIRAGQFPLTIFSNGSKDAECAAWCPLRHACRHPEGYAVSNW